MIRASLCAIAKAAPFPPNFDRIRLYSSPSGDLLFDMADAAILRICPALFLRLGNLLLMTLPPEIFVLGARFSQAAKCFALAHFVISTPTSAINSTAVFSPTEGILHRSIPVSAIRYWFA